MFYRFQCTTNECVYNETPCLLLNATKSVLCGSCNKTGTAIALTNEEAIELGLIT
jgi:hypothetical protein